MVDDDPSRVLGGARLRRFLADQYFKGRGLEIGALHRPMWVPDGVRMSYADSFTTEELASLWSPEVDGHAIAAVDVVTDATTLQGVGDAEFDFVIASHVVEHLEDPIACLRNLARVVKPGGCVFLALPDRRQTFDAARPPTSIEHVMRDHCGHAEASRRGHYEEWVALAEKLSGDAAKARVRALESVRYPIHFHVWTPDEFSELLHELPAAVGLPLTIDLFKAHGAEGIWVLRDHRVDRPVPGAVPRGGLLRRGSHPTGGRAVVFLHGEHPHDDLRRSRRSLLRAGDFVYRLHMDGQQQRPVADGVPAAGESAAIDVDEHQH